MRKKSESTFDKFMKDKDQKEQFYKEYNQFLLSEFLLDAMHEEHISVRKLSEKSGVSTSIIQNIKTEKATNVTLKTIFALASTLGYRINFEKIEYKHS
jgi:DNA-binding Xre family transcriptional regulator